MRHAFALLAAAALAAPAAAQPREEIRGEGTEAFRAVVASYGLKPLNTLDEALSDPQRTLIISFRGLIRRNSVPKDPLEDLQKGEIKSFVDNGGAVLIATDITTKAEWTESYDVTVEGSRVYGNPSECYLGKGECPYVKGIPGTDPDLFAMSGRTAMGVFTGPPMKVATNRPTFLRLPKNYKSELTPLGYFANYTSFHADGPFDDTSLCFAQGKRYGSGGRMLVLADHSVFINSMLLPPYGQTNNNLDFAQYCLNWLATDPDNGRRDRVLFISDEKIETNFDLIISELPPVTPEEVMKHVLNHPEEALKFLAENPDFRDFLWENRDKASPLLAELEDAGVFSALGESDIFNRSILGIFPLWVVIRNVLFMATLLLLGYAAMKFLGSKWKGVKNVPRLAVVLERFRPRAGLLEQRLRDGVAAGQYYEAARERAQLLFADLGLSPAAEGPPPSYTIAAGRFERGRIDRELREIWGIAYGTEPRPVTAKAWAKWPSRLAALRDWIQDGVIRFE